MKNRDSREKEFDLYIIVLLRKIQLSENLKLILKYHLFLSLK